MFTANNRNYGLTISLFWGSTDKPVTDADGFKSAVRLNDSQVNRFELNSTLLTPWLFGSFEYFDNRKTSRLKNLADVPLIYGKIDFCQYDGVGGQYSATVSKPFQQELFTEFVVIDSVGVVSEDGDTITFRFEFSMADSVALKSSMNAVSTFTDDSTTVKFRDLVKSLFGASNIDAKFDYDTISVDADISFISSFNSTFMDSIEYVYRKVFDDNFSNRNGKDFCKIVYNNGERKYEMWRLGDIGTENMFKCTSKNAHYKDVRENVVVSVGKECGQTPNTAEIINCGNAGDFHRALGIKTFIDYDYLKNTFEDITDFYVENEFMSHSDAIYTSQKSKASVIKNNSLLFPKLVMCNCYSTYRKNGSLYDVFNKMIFDSSFVRVTTMGCLGRYAGNGISLRFSNAESSAYAHLGGSYMITGMSHVLVRNGDEWKFSSTMDLFKPFMESDSKKEAIQ